jgi:predicted AlkP superfamily pyrophosphatase or phosphodiesterase
MPTLARLARLALGLVLLTVSAALLTSAARATPHRQLLIIVDGLRPDYVTADVMPTLTAIGTRGVVFTRHHSVYPTVTRVNASSISTGSYPETHGLLGNTVFFPRVDATKFLDTADRANLVKVGETEGRLLTTQTLGEILQQANKRLLVVSSGSSGSAFLNNHTVAGGAILHYQYVLPERLAEDMKMLSPPPTDDSPSGSLDRYAVDAFLKVGLPRVDPTVAVIWLGDLDGTTHAKGVGAPATVATLRQVDDNVKRIEDGLRAAGLFDDYSIWVSSDHGFSTHTGGVDLAGLLSPFAHKMSDGSPAIVASGGAIYVRDEPDKTVPAIVTALQRTAGVGAIFTRAKSAGAFEGYLPGTLSFDAIRWTHARSAQILFSPDWTDRKNAHGWPGSTASSGTAGHGSSSPFDVHNTLIAAGPDLKRGARIDLPSANVDFAPTFLTLLGLPVPSSMQGRVLREGLADGPAPKTTDARSTEVRVSALDAGYTLTGTFSTIDSGGKSYRYFDRTAVVRR